MANKINWTVDEVAMDYAVNKLRAEVSGKPEALPFIGRLNDVHKDLQMIINSGSRAAEEPQVATVEMTRLYTKLGIHRRSSIKKVIFNDPAVIVSWVDGTKTVVKAQHEVYDPEKGLAMAIAKKAFGNQGNYYNEISRWTDEYWDSKCACLPEPPSEEYVGKLAQEARDLSETLRKALYPKVSPEARHFVSNAHQALSEVTSRKRVTKAHMQAAMEVAIEYLGHVLDD